MKIEKVNLSLFVDSMTVNVENVLESIRLKEQLSGLTEITEITQDE